MNLAPLDLLLFAGGLWLLVPFAVVMPGMRAQQLCHDHLAATTDAGLSTVVTPLVPAAGPAQKTARTRRPGLRTTPAVLWCGLAVIGGVALFFIRFW